MDWDMRPDRIRSGELKPAIYELCACGLSSDTVHDVIIDERIALVQPHPDASLFLCPLRAQPQPSLDEAWFYADCIAFEHDIPALVIPTRGQLSRFNHRYYHNGRTRPRRVEIVSFDPARPTLHYVEKPVHPRAAIRHNLLGQILDVLTLTREMRHGPMTYVLFRTYMKRDREYIPYSSLYRGASIEMGLYAAALRQSDFLAEFLGYYRVIESVSGDNGKGWIRGAIAELAQHEWRTIHLMHQDDPGGKPKDIMTIQRRRAIARLRELHARLGGDAAVAKYLYETNRCGIAHGKRDVIMGDITAPYFEVARDALLVKLLARMAIDRKVAHV